MNITEITTRLANRPKGSIFSLTTRRLAKVKKGVTAYIEKQSQIQGLFGVEYANTANVKSAIQSGEREKPHLPNGVKRCFYENNLKFYEGFNGNISMGVNVSGNKPKSIFFLDGKMVDEETVQNMVLSSELTPKKTRAELVEKNQSPFVMVNLQNVVDVR